MKILSAKYVLPISAEAIEDGAIAYENDKIVDVGKRCEIAAKFPEAVEENLGETAILPGFVNAHSHLELTAMRGFMDKFDADFLSWLLNLTKVREETLTEDDLKIAAMFGALEGVKSGVTCFGDIGRFGKTGFDALKLSGLRGILFQETEFSVLNTEAKADFARLQEKFFSLQETETDLVKAGISPHSTYTVSESLFEKITEFSLEENVKLTIHTAESTEEERFMKNGTGLFAELYKKYDIEWVPPQCSTVEYLDKIGVLGAKPLLAHCVKVSDNDIELIAKSDSRVAHCPKSNAKFGHGIAPLKKFSKAKIKTAFGSDSVASNNVCDILEEARFAILFARNLPEIEGFIGPKEAIETATLGGAKSLGLENLIGSLEAGKQADFIAISLDKPAQMPVHDVYSALIFASNRSDVFLSVVAGEEIYRSGNAKMVDEKELKNKMIEIRNKML